MGSNLTISTANATVLLPCATISTANQIDCDGGNAECVAARMRIAGRSAASGSQGGTVFAVFGTGAMVQVGDPTYAADTSGFHMDNVVINTTGPRARRRRADCLSDAGDGSGELVFPG
jgi:hypothetical protein